MSDVFEEVEESLRQDKASLWWKRYGIFVWALGIAIVAFVAYSEWSGAQKDKQTVERVIAFETARAQLADGDYASAEAGFSDLITGGSDIAPLAAQLLAQTQYEGNGDLDSAAATLQASAQSGADGPVERLALLKSAYLKSGNMNLAELEAYLGDLPSRPTAIGVLATELIAAKAFSEGDFSRARAEFSYLQFAANVPPGVVQRAEVALTVIPVPDDAEEAAVSQLPLGPTPEDETSSGPETQGAEQ